MIPCEHCGISEYTELHHVSYFPQILMRLCFDCHRVIHKSKHQMYDKYKQYQKGDAQNFYAGARYRGQPLK